jgi:hypothetical protein
VRYLVGGSPVSVRIMPSTSVIAALVPHFEGTSHVVLDDFGQAGRVYRETAEATATLESVIDDLLTGQFNNPARVVSFNTSQGWSRDVSEDVVHEVMRRLAGRARPLAASSRKFVEAYVDEDELLPAESGAS